MNTSEAIRARRSIRKYEKGVVIPKAHIEQLLEAAMMAPSARNGRPWEFVVVKDPAIKEQIRQAHPYCNHITDATLAIVICGVPSVESPYKEGFWPQDCAAACENLLLQAWELGWGTCWCGVHPDKERATALQQILQVQSVPLALITVGRPAETPDARGFYDAAKVKVLGE